MGRTSTTAPPFERGNGVAVKHGCHSVIRLEPRAQEIADGLRGIVPNYAPRLEPMLTLFALNAARIELAVEWLEEHGYWDAKGKPRPPLHLVSTWQSEARRQLSALGMDNTPQSRAVDAIDLIPMLAASDADLRVLADELAAKVRGMDGGGSGE